MNLRTLDADPRKGPLFVQLRKRRDAALDAAAAANEAQARQAVAMRDRDLLKRELVEAHAEGVPSAIRKASKAIADHDCKAEEDAARVEGLALAAERRESELRAFIAAELDGLLDEHGATADAARTRVVNALNGIEKAVAAWGEAARTTTDLVTAAGRGVDLRAATLPRTVTNVSREASRVDPSTLPAPLLADAQHASVCFPPNVPASPGRGTAQ